MTLDTGHRGATTPAAHLEELLRAIGRALRAFQMYLPNNPMYQRAEQVLSAAFTPVWEEHTEIVLAIGETEITWEDQAVYSQASRGESLAWFFYKDGMRFLTLREGVEEEEIARFLRIVNRARLLPADAGDDLLTLLWEEDFSHLQYQFAEVIGETVVLDPQALDFEAAEASPAEVQERVRQDPAPPARAPGVVDLDDFDSTLYFLEDSEVNRLIRQVEQEYERDSRQSALDALLDVFELVPQSAVRLEVLGTFESLFPSLLSHGEFRTASVLLRELTKLRDRDADLPRDIEARLGAFQERLSEPGIVTQLIQALDEMDGPGQGSSDAVGQMLQELRAPALETILIHLPKVTRPPVRELLASAAERLAASNTQEVLRLLRGEGGQTDALPGLVMVCGRLELQAAVPGLALLLTHADDTMRLAAVEALGAIGSPGALAALEPALDDAERTVRVAAAGIVGRRGYRGALPRLEAVVSGKRGLTLERSEKLQYFEAYAEVAGPAGLELLRGILVPRGFLRRRESAETRTCAAYAIGRIRTTEAREVLRLAEEDKELTVRNAVSRILRDWPA